MRLGVARRDVVGLMGGLDMRIGAGGRARGSAAMWAVAMSALGALRLAVAL